MSSEYSDYEDLAEIFKLLNFKTAVVQDNVVIYVRLRDMPPAESVAEGIEQFNPVFKNSRINFKVEAFTGASLKTLLGNVGTTHQITRNDGQDQAKLKEINDKSNLLRLFLSGFAFRLKGEVSAQYLKAGRDWIYKELQKPSKQFDLLQALDQKLLRFAAFALNGISLRVNLSEEETFNLFLDSFPRTANWPDALDLIDELGVLVERMRLIREYDNTPFFRAFIDALHDYAKANIEVGLTCESFTLSGSFQTEGLKELFDHIMTGMVDE